MFNVIATVAESVSDLNTMAALVFLRTMTATALASQRTWLGLQLWALGPAGNKKKSVADDMTNVVASDQSERKTMYTLSKAKEEIDAIAKHAFDIAAHALAIDENLDAKLASFKQDILASIEAKLSDLERVILGESHGFESSAISDLGAKVALLKHKPAPAPHQDGGGYHGGYASPSYDDNLNAGHQSDHYSSGSY